MEIYENRLFTFIQYKWPYREDRGYATAQQFATAGFYFSPSVDSKDAVVCYMCRKELDSWHHTDDPWQAHVAHGKIRVFRTVGKGPNSIVAEESIDCPLTALDNRSNRLATFVNWPKKSVRNMKATPETLANAGFYFCPTKESADLTRCYHCPIGLDCWDPTDDPMTEHSRRNPACPHLLKKPKVPYEFHRNFSGHLLPETERKSSKTATETSIRTQPSPEAETPRRRQNSSRQGPSTVVRSSARKKQANISGKGPDTLFNQVDAPSGEAVPNRRPSTVRRRRKAEDPPLSSSPIDVDVTETPSTKRVKVYNKRVAYEKITTSDLPHLLNDCLEPISTETSFINDSSLPSRGSFAKPSLPPLFKPIAATGPINKIVAESMPETSSTAGILTELIRKRISNSKLKKKELKFDDVGISLSKESSLADYSNLLTKLYFKALDANSTSLISAFSTSAWDVVLKKAPEKLTKNGISSTAQASCADLASRLVLDAIASLEAPIKSVLDSFRFALCQADNSIRPSLRNLLLNDIFPYNIDLPLLLNLDIDENNISDNSNSIAVLFESLESDRQERVLFSKNASATPSFYFPEAAARATSTPKSISTALAPDDATFSTYEEDESTIVRFSISGQNGNGSDKTGDDMRNRMVEIKLPSKILAGDDKLTSLKSALLDMLGSLRS